MKQFWRCLWRATVGVYDHGSLGYAKGAAYSSMLAFLPVLTTMTAWLVQANAVTVSKRIARVLFDVAPPGTDGLVRTQIMERGERPLTLPVLATLLALWAASGVMISLMDGFQAAYGGPSKRSIYRKRLIAVWLVLIAVLPSVGATAAVLAGERAELSVLRWMGVLEKDEVLRGGVHFVGAVVRYAVTLAAIVLVTAGLYYFGPEPKARGRAIWPGACLATVLWLAITSVFGWYVRNIADYNVLYGTIGAVIALLSWMFLLSVVALLGCEFNVALDRRK